MAYDESTLAGLGNFDYSNPNDVRAVQSILNYNSKSKLKTDGVFGPKTSTALANAYKPASKPSIGSSESLTQFNDNANQMNAELLTSGADTSWAKGIDANVTSNGLTMSPSLASFNNEYDTMFKEMNQPSGSNGWITSYLGGWKNPFSHGSYSDYKSGGGTMTETDWNAANNASDRFMLGAGMGLGQLGLGVMSYLGQKEMNKKNLQLADQQIANNSDIMATRKARQADIARTFGSGSNAAKI